MKDEIKELIEVPEGLEPDEELEELSDFDIEALIVEGTSAVIERKITYYDVNKQKKMRMPVYLKPLSHSTWNQITRATSKKGSNKNIEELAVHEGLVDKAGLQLQLSQIKGMQKGVVSSIYEEIKLISGQFEDKLEDKMLEKLTDF